MGQAGYPTDPVEAWAGAIAVAGPIIVAAAGSTNPGAVLLVQEPTSVDCNLGSETMAVAVADGRRSIPAPAARPGPGRCG